MSGAHEDTGRMEFHEACARAAKREEDTTRWAPSAPAPMDVSREIANDAERELDAEEALDAADDAFRDDFDY